MKLSDYVIDFLVRHGVKHVFMLPGGGAMHLNDSLGRRRHDTQFVAMLHEQAVSIAVEGYVKVSNNLGVGMVTSGPAGTNAVTGVAGAWLDSMPCLFLSGQVKRPDLKTGTGLRQLGSQEVDIVKIVESITKYAVTITEPESIRFHLEKAVHLAKTGRPGPVWIDIPLDVQAIQIDPEKLVAFVPPILTKTKSIPDQVEELVHLLLEAKRPVIVAGNGIRVAGAIQEFHQAIDRIKAPVLSTWLAMDLIDDANPLFAGRPGAIAPRGANFSLQNADLMVVIGSRLDMAFTGYAHDKLARGAKKVMVDIDEAEIKKMKTTVDLPIVADAREVLTELLSQLGNVNLPNYSDWVVRTQEWKNKYPVVLKEHRENADHISVYHFSDVLSDELSEGDLVVSGSSGTAVELFLLSFKVKRKQRIFHTRGLGSMGFGLPSSIGACLASNSQRTICIDGDGGFQMNIQELATIRRLNLPIKCFVINNGGYSSIRSSQQNYFQHLVAADETSGLHLPDLQKVSAAYEIPTVRLISQEGLPEKIREILETPGPIICEIMAIPDEARIPRLSTIQKNDGSIVSRPLEDLWPFLDREEFLTNMIVPALED